MEAHEWQPTTKRPETEVTISLCTRIFVPLCREVLLEGKYCRILEKRGITDIRSGNLGLGRSCTWHGTPDARVRGTEVICRTSQETVGGTAEDVASDLSESETQSDISIGKVLDTTPSPAFDTSNVDSDGDSTVVEGKVSYKEINLLQAVGTCVVASFTAKAWYSTKRTNSNLTHR